ncbi:UDP-glycosyltransferase 73C6 [Hordeum vulgare]|nr:UDP-glycosyltransferase 73C6 [Hordeum vulgare]
MTSAAGGLAPAPVVRPRAPFLKLPNAVRPKKGKVSTKKNKAEDDSGSSKPSKKKLAGCVTAAAATEAPASSLVEPAADAQKVFEEMHQSVNDEACISTMGVGSNNSHWSQTNDMHFDDHEFEFNIAQNLFKGEEKKAKKGKIQKGRPFTLPHCYEELKDGEKWKKRDSIDDVDESNKRKRTIELDHDEEEASSDDSKRSPTRNSVSYSKPKRPDGCKKDTKEKKKRKGDGELKNAMEAIVKARKEANEVRKMARTQDAVAEERRLAAEQRRVAAEERKVTLEERKVGMEERSRAMIRDMGGGGIGGMGGGGIGGMGGGGIGGMGAMGGFGEPPGGIGGGGIGGMGAMGGFGDIMETMGGMDGFGAPPCGIGGMGGMSFASLMGGMGITSGRHGLHVFRCANTFA